MEPLTCTFSDLIIPNCGISMHKSNIWMIFAGIPSFSFPSTNAIFSGNSTFPRVLLVTVCSNPTIAYPASFSRRRYPGSSFAGHSSISTHSSAVTLV